MRRTRNLIALLMAAVMCLCLFAGCGSSNNGNDSEAVDLTKATSLADLAGCKIAAQAGTFHADALTQIKNVQSSTYPEFADLLTASPALSTAMSQKSRQPSPSASPMTT